MDDMTLADLIDAYWDAAYAEGKEGRDTDTPEGLARSIRARIDAHLAGMGEPAAWQYRILDDEEGPSPYWQDMSHKQFELFREAANPRYELRQLYTAQPASGDWDAVRGAVPTNWLDPLLTGPDAVIGSYPYSNSDIERLLTAVRQRLTAALPENAK